jgi:hypothetical protein
MSIPPVLSPPNFNSAWSALAVCAAALGLSAAPLVAEGEKATFDPKNAVDPGLGMPSPYDKFLALDQVLDGRQVPWQKHLAEISKKVDPDAFTDAAIQIPMVLGVRIADGVMAVKARDAEKLNACADDIEALARKMGIKDEELTRARKARTLANNNEWLKVFMELGFLQQDIMSKIDAPQNKTRGDLLVIAGWMQGLRYTSTVVGGNHSPEVSNYLREPMLVKALIERAAALPAGVRANPLVQATEQALPGIHAIVNIPVDGAISREDVAKLLAAADALVARIVAPAP